MHRRLLEIVTTIAADQFGVITWAQMRAQRIGASTISRWEDAGLLHRIHPGVYAVGHRTLTREGRWMAAQLAVAPHGALTHWTAAAILETAPARGGWPHVTVPPTHSARRLGLEVHRSPLGDDDVIEWGPWRITSWARTIVDLADIATDRQIAGVIDGTIERGLYDQALLDEVLRRSAGRHGLKRLLPALAVLKDIPDRYRSDTERRTRDELVALDLPAPEVNATIPRGNGRYVELDLFWRRARINVEIDGPHHLLPLQRAVDEERDAWLRTQDILVLRYPVETARAAAIAADVRPLLAVRTGTCVH